MSVAFPVAKYENRNLAWIKEGDVVTQPGFRPVCSFLWTINMRKTIGVTEIIKCL